MSPNRCGMRQCNETTPKRLKTREMEHQRAWGRDGKTREGNGQAYKGTPAIFLFINCFTYYTQQHPLPSVPNTKTCPFGCVCVFGTLPTSKTCNRHPFVGCLLRLSYTKHDENAVSAFSSCLVPSPFAQRDEHAQFGVFIVLGTLLFSQTCRTHLFGVCFTYSSYLARRTHRTGRVLHARSRLVLTPPLSNTKGHPSGHSLGVRHPTHPQTSKMPPKKGHF